MNLKGLNEADVEFLDRWLMDVAVEERLDVRHMPLLRCSVGRIAANCIRAEYPKRMGDGWGSPLPYRPDLRHIVDWFTSAVAEGAAWLSNVDGKGRPRKLLKCGTYADLVREADKATARKNAQVSKALGPDDEQPVADLADGYCLVRLLTPAALDFESRRMHHCVGHGSYDEGLTSGQTEIYSLRDPKGRPVMTIEIDREESTIDDEGVLGPLTRRNDIDQISGKHNDRPAAAHLALLKEYAREAGWGGRQEYWPTVTDVDGVEHDVGAIPGGTVFEKLSVNDWYVSSLPDGQTVHGDCYLGRSVTAVPDRLTVGSNLILSPKFSIALPESLLVGGMIRVWAESMIAQPRPEHLKEKIEVQRAFVGSGMLFARFQSEDHHAELGDIEI